VVSSAVTANIRVEANMRILLVLVLS